MPAASGSVVEAGVGDAARKVDLIEPECRRAVRLRVGVPTKHVRHATLEVQAREPFENLRLRFRVDLVEASAAVTATQSRNEKVGLLAALLARAGPDEVAPVLSWLSGGLTQRQIGVG